MIFWIIKYGPNKLKGWQVMNQDKSDATLYDNEGNFLSGNFDYYFVAESEIPPAWWSDDMVKKENIS